VWWDDLDDLEGIDVLYEGLIIEYERLCVSPLDAPVKIMTISSGSLIVTIGVGVAVKSS
jgi:hypothetical protein